MLTVKDKMNKKLEVINSAHIFSLLKMPIKKEETVYSYSTHWKNRVWMFDCCFNFEYGEL